VASSEDIAGNVPPMDRRGFLQLGGTALLGLGLPSLLRSDRLDRIGIQLYSLRGEMEKDFEGTLARVAEIGYAEVEFAGYFGRTPAQVAAAIKRAGLSALSAHVPFPELEKNWAQVLDAARSVGHRYLIIPAIPEEERSTPQAMKRMAAMFERAGGEANAAGIRCGFHNHDVDFVPFRGAGELSPFDILLQETSPEHVAFELDLYWITKAGRDPLAYFARYPGRFELVHVKDSAGPPGHRMVDVGRGTIDFRRIFARREQAGIRHYFVEHDEPADPFGFARASYQHLRRLEF
jgi:sugar phosphate isomerase/epimerase